MADNTTPSPQAPVTFDALLADRQAFWGSFTNATTIAAGAVIALVVLMGIFLV
jgi:hypothetical protein